MHCSVTLSLDSGEWLSVLHTFETSPCPLNYSLNWHAIKNVLFGENFMDIIGNFYYWKSGEIIPLNR